MSDMDECYHCGASDWKQIASPFTEKPWIVCKVCGQQKQEECVVLPFPEKPSVTDAVKRAQEFLDRLENEKND